MYSESKINVYMKKRREKKSIVGRAIHAKARSHIETQLNSTVELSWVSVSFNM